MTLPAKFDQLRSYARKDGAGIGVSFLLHTAVLLLILFTLAISIVLKPRGHDMPAELSQSGSPSALSITHV